MTVKKRTVKKYELTDDTIEHDGHTLHRIRALVDIPVKEVSVGDLGGYVESEKNLSHEGTCWVGMDAVVRENAVVSGRADVRDHAIVKGDALVKDRALVKDNAVVSGRAVVEGDAVVSENVVVGDYAIVHRRDVVEGGVVFEDVIVVG